MTRKLKHIVADMKAVGPICYDRCTCDLGNDTTPQFAHFHAETCPVGDHARKFYALQLEYSQAYPHSWLGRLRKSGEWLDKGRFSIPEVMVFIAVALAIAGSRYWSALGLSAVQVVVWWLVYRLNKIKSSS